MVAYKTRTEYVTVIFHLTPDSLGNRRKALDVFGDVIYIDTTRTTADLSNVYIGVDDKDLIPCNLTTRLDIRPHFFRKIKVEWSSVNDGKSLYLIVGREASLQITPPTGVVIVAEHALPKDSSGNIKVDIANYEAMSPSDIQAVYKDKAVLYSGTVTANGSTGDIDVSNFSVLEIELKVTSVSGTSPTLSVYIEGKFEDTGDYKPLVYQEFITSTGTWFFTITKLAFRYIRVRWVVGGTSPSFTFGVYAQMLVL